MGPPFEVATMKEVNRWGWYQPINSRGPKTGCKLFKAPPNGKVTCTDGLKPGSVCEIGCQGDLTLEPHYALRKKPTCVCRCKYCPCVWGNLPKDTMSGHYS